MTDKRDPSADPAWRDLSLRLAVGVLALLFLAATVANNLAVPPVIFRVLLLVAAILAFSDRTAAGTLLVTVPLLGVFWTNGQFSLPLAAVAGELYRQLRARRPAIPRPVLLDAGVGLFVLASVVSLPFALEPRVSLAVAARVLVLATTYFFVSRALAEPGRGRSILVAFAAVAVYSSLVGIAQATRPGLGIGYPYAVPTGISFPLLRATGLDENPNTFAVSLVLAGLICLDRVFSAETMRGRLVWVVGLLVLVVGIEMSFTRTAYVGFLLGAALLVWLRLPKARTAILVSAIGVALIVTSALLTGAFARGGSVLDFARDSSSMDRVYLSGASVRIFRDHPLTGVGVGGFAEAYKAYSDPRVTVSPVTDPHQSPFSVPAEGGILALLAEIAVIAALVLALRRARKAGGRKDASYLGLAAGVAFLAMSLFSTEHFLNVFWIALAIAAAFMLAERASASLAAGTSA